jgi:ESCRT-I complex subunit TSG101
VLIEKVEESLRVTLTSLYRDTADDIDTIFETQGTVRESSEQLQETLSLLAQERAGLETIAKKLDEDLENTRKWLEENEGKEELDLDQVVYPQDSWSQQMLEAVAEDAAIQDAMDELQRALRDDKIDIVKFLKAIRRLARKQFNARALALKIHEQQRKKSQI